MSKFVAIVYPTMRTDASIYPVVRDDKDEAVNAALTLMDKHAAGYPSYGYQVLVGELTERAMPVQKFALVPLKEQKGA